MSGRVAGDPLGRALGLRRWRGCGTREVGAGAEVALARGGEHDRADVEVRVRVPEVLDEPVAHVAGDGVALVGPVDRQPEHAVLEVRDQFLVDVDAFRRRR